jgi:hypothetical protein
MDSELLFESCGDKNSESVETILFIHSFMNSKMEWISTVHYIEETGRPFHFLLPSIGLQSRNLSLYEAECYEPDSHLMESSELVRSIAR